MISWKELSGTANYAYKRSLDAAEIEKNCILLKSEMDKGWLNEENAMSAEALYIRAYAKFYALKYFCGGYLTEDYDALYKFVMENLANERVQTYPNTVAVITAVKDYAKAVSAIMEDAYLQKLRIIDAGGEIEADDFAVCEEVAEVFKNKISKAEELGDFKSVFGPLVTFPDVKAQVIADLTEVYNLASKRADKLKLGAAEGFFNENVEIVSDSAKCCCYEFYPIISGGESKLADAVVLYTPFEGEALLAAVKSCTGAVGCIEGAAFSLVKGDVIQNFFSVAQKRGVNLVIYGINEYNGENLEDILKGAVSFGKSGLKVYLTDFSGKRDIYDKAIKAAAAGGNSAMDISCFYLTMPILDDVLDIFEEYKLVSSASEERDYVRKNMPFMGYVGLNEAVTAFAAGGDWRKTAKSYSDNNRAQVKRYLDNLTSQSLFIEKRWGDFSEDMVIEKSTGFNYDDLAEVDKKNISKIMLKHMSIFAKCGCIVKYCTLAGADKSLWRQLDVKTQEERLTKATRLVFRLLTVPIEPEVKVLDKLDENDNAGGLCCDGGKRILYRTDCVQDYDYIIDCVCHESYHAFQHLVMYGAWSEWYWTEFGVTKGRRDEWLCNTGSVSKKETDNLGRLKRGRYFSDTRTDAYYVQVVECEARAFANDCMREADAVWHEINFE